MTGNREVTLPLLATVVTGAHREPDVVCGWRQVTFRYSPADPWAVILDIASGQGWVRWCFARALLADGLNTPVGHGDVWVFASRDGQRVYVDLHSPTGTVVLCFARGDIERALDRCEDLVPEGTEHTAVDWNREWALLGEVA